MTYESRTTKRIWGYLVMSPAIGAAMFGNWWNGCFVRVCSEDGVADLVESIGLEFPKRQKNRVIGLRHFLTVMALRLAVIQENRRFKQPTLEWQIGTNIEKSSGRIGTRNLVCQTINKKRCPRRFR